MRRPNLNRACRCGQAITNAHIVRQTRFVEASPTEGEPPLNQFIHIQYRCPHCRRVGEYVQRLDSDPAE